MNGLTKVISDLTYVYFQVPLLCLVHLRAMRHRLVRGTYQTSDGRGCLMYLLTELLPPDQRIDSKAALTRYFGRKGSSPDYVLADDPFYQPAKWIVRLWDGQICEGVRARYGECDHLSEELAMTVLDSVIAERQEAECEGVKTETDLIGDDAVRTGGISHRGRKAARQTALAVADSTGGGP